MKKILFLIFLIIFGLIGYFCFAQSLMPSNNPNKSNPQNIRDRNTEPSIEPSTKSNIEPNKEPIENQKPEEKEKKEENQKPDENETKFKFISFKENEELEGEIKIKGQIKNASSIDFYIQGSREPLARYLGNAKFLSENTWSFLWNTENTPNGEYNFFIEVSTEKGGKYRTGDIKIIIKNKEKKNIEQKEEQKIKEEQIKNVKNEIEHENNRIKEEKEKIKNEIKEDIEPGKKNEIEQKIDTLTKKIIEKEIVEKQITILSQDIKKIETQINKTKQNINNLPRQPIQSIKQDTQLQMFERQKEKKQIEQTLETSKHNSQKIEKEIKQIRDDIKDKVKKKDEVVEKLGNLEKFISEKQKEIFEKNEILTKDSDGDGLSDEEEIRIGTNLIDPDTDKDGFLDGLEIKSGYNALKSGPFDKIVYQDPRKVSPKKTEIYKIEKVELVDESNLKITGKGLPNSFVILYIFSSPIVITVKTDNNGNWEYILDKTKVTNGQHTVYAATTDNNGGIDARSESFVFMKTNNKVYRIFEETEAAVISPLQSLQKTFVIFTIGIIILSLILALILIGILINKKRNN